MMVLAFVMAIPDCIHKIVVIISHLVNIVQDDILKNQYTWIEHLDGILCKQILQCTTGFSNTFFLQVQ